MLSDVLDLLYGVRGLIATILCILCGKDLRHINAVKPHLVRVDKLVPEAAMLGAGLLGKVLCVVLDSKAVLFLSRPFIKLEKHTALVDIVKVVLCNIIADDRAVLTDVVVDKRLGKFKIPLVAGYARYFKKRRYHTAVNVVPLRRLSLANAFNIPHRRIRT